MWGGLGCEILAPKSSVVYKAKKWLQIVYAQALWIPEVNYLPMLCIYVQQSPGKIYYEQKLC